MTPEGLGHLVPGLIRWLDPVRNQPAPGHTVFISDVELGAVPGPHDHTGIIGRKVLTLEGG